MCDIILELKIRDFHKSMTTYAESAVWQDVYRTSTASGTAVYLKLTVIDDLLVVSFKELNK
jgi:motility quorum-sensing regulator/GCU-specific mRNA interferase toxin